MRRLPPAIVTLLRHRTDNLERTPSADGLDGARIDGMKSRKSQNTSTLMTMLALLAAGAGAFHYLSADEPRVRGIAGAEPSTSAATGLFGGLGDGGATAPTSAPVVSAPEPVAIIPDRSWIYDPAEAGLPSAVFGIQASDVGFRLTCGVDSLDFDLWQSNIPASAKVRIQAGDRIIDARLVDGNLIAAKDRAWLSAAAIFGFTITLDSVQEEAAHSDPVLRQFVNDCVTR